MYGRHQYGVTIMPISKPKINYWQNINVKEIKDNGRPISIFLSVKLLYTSNFRFSPHICCINLDIISSIDFKYSSILEIILYTRCSISRGYIIHQIQQKTYVCSASMMVGQQDNCRKSLQIPLTFCHC